MKYYLETYSPETARAFDDAPRDVTGFKRKWKKWIQKENMGPGDRLICYCTRIQRFIGVFELESGPTDNTAESADENDSYPIKLKIKELAWVSLEQGLSIHEDTVWNNLSFTRDLAKHSKGWTYVVRSSPSPISSEDGRFLEEVLLEQSEKRTRYPFSDAERRQLKVPKKKINDKKEVVVTTPEDEELEPEPGQTSAKDIRNSIRAQARLAELGEKLGFKIWLPRNDRSRVLKVWSPQEDSILDRLPLGLDREIQKRIENIDVLWIKRRSIVRAFEVEDTTSIYSGILRMADLLALQPNLDIKIHIVAPAKRRYAVFEEITRPVFDYMDSGPLSKSCSYISYDSLEELAEIERLEHMTDNIIEEYVKYPEVELESS